MTIYIEIVGGLALLKTNSITHTHTHTDICDGFLDFRILDLPLSRITIQIYNAYGGRMIYKRGRSYSHS